MAGAGDADKPGPGVAVGGGCVRAGWHGRCNADRLNGRWMGWRWHGRGEGRNNGGDDWMALWQGYTFSLVVHSVNQLHPCPDPRQRLPSFCCHSNSPSLCFALACFGPSGALADHVAAAKQGGRRSSGYLCMVPDEAMAVRAQTFNTSFVVWRHLVLETSLLDYVREVNDDGESQKRLVLEQSFSMCPVSGAIQCVPSCLQQGAMTQWGDIRSSIRSHRSAHCLCLHGSLHTYATIRSPHRHRQQADQGVVLWNATGEIKSYALLEGHKGAVLDVHWSRDAGTLFSASADATLASWDTETGQRTRRHIGHEGVINAMDISKHGKETLVSACDDGHIGIWDARQRDIVDFMETSFPVTAIAFAENGIELFSGGIDNDIKVWDMRKKQVTYVMKGHQDTITSLEISPDTRTLLSNSHDSTVRTWNIQPFEGGTNRLIKSYDGAPTGMEKNLLKASWDAKGERIAAGSGDRSTVVWDVRSGKLLHKLPGHRGAVNDVRFSPGEEPTSKLLRRVDYGCLLTHGPVLSASSDRTLLLGELKK
ncbi:hypothetical protein FH972_025176 [Carpinus fangiana]|uniref:Uncharacterized protein n=1 Tax=Carpinus fangiana TaxID=176857 RepID=A0A5N6L088_9ROSI|nr:hypothetical protein FH972_025176 [Carpinus fangiana]